MHYIQRLILQYLAINSHSRFSKVKNNLGIKSDLCSYHLKALISLGYVDKNTDKLYSLTWQGKQQVSLVDLSQSNPVEIRQGTKSVVIFLFNSSDYSGDMLLHTRLKEPYKNYSGGITGKVRYGETLFDASERIVMERTGLKASLNYHGIAHYLMANKDFSKEYLDKYFFIFGATNPSGDLISETQTYSNKYLPLNRIYKEENIFINLKEMIDMLFDNNKNFIEKKLGSAI